MPENTVETESAVARHTRLTHPPEHLANERTYLAYLRTSVSLMSFGLAINRFSFYLAEFREMQVRKGSASVLVGSQQLGIAMVILGMALLVWASIYYHQVFQQIEAQDFRPKSGGIFVISSLLFVAGIISLVWLFVS